MLLKRLRRRWLWLRTDIHLWWHDTRHDLGRAVCYCRGHRYTWIGAGTLMNAKEDGHYPHGIYAHCERCDGVLWLSPEPVGYRTAGSRLLFGHLIDSDDEFAED